MENSRSMREDIAQQRIAHLRELAAQENDPQDKIKHLAEAFDLLDQADLPVEERENVVREYTFANERLNRLDENIGILESEIANLLSEDLKSAASYWFIDLSRYYCLTKKFSKSTETIQQGLLLSEEIDNARTKSGLLLNYGLINVTINAYDRALENFLQVIDIIEGKPNRKLLISAYLNLINVNNNLGIYEDALKFADKAIKLGEELDLKAEHAAAYINRGTTYSNMRRFDEAISDFHKGIELLEESNLMPQWLLNGYVNLANMYILKERYDEANQWLQKALPLTKSTFDPNQQASVLTILGKLHIEKDDLKTALKYLIQAEELVEDLNLNETRTLIFEQMARLYGNMQMQGKQAEYLQKVIDIMRDSFPEDLNNRIANHKVRWETERKERESELLRKKNQELEQVNAELKEMYNKLSEAHVEILKLERKNSIFAMAVTANHEINQPLMIIKGNVEMLEMKYGNEEIEPYIHRIDKATIRIEQILTRYKEQHEYSMQNYSDTTEMVVFEQKDTSYDK